MRPRIRLACAADVAAAARVQRRSALVAYRAIFPPEAPQPTPDQFTARWAEAIAAPTPAAVLVAEVEGSVVGVVAVGPDDRAPRTGHLTGLYVDPDHWRRRIGRTLYDAAVAHLVGAGYEEATLWVLEENRRARAMYERRGWALDGTTLEHRSGPTEVGYRRALRS